MGNGAQGLSKLRWSSPSSRSRHRTARFPPRGRPCTRWSNLPHPPWDRCGRMRPPISLSVQHTEDSAGNIVCSSTHCCSVLPSTLPQGFCSWSERRSLEELRIVQKPLQLLCSATMRDISVSVFCARVRSSHPKPP